MDVMKPQLVWVEGGCYRFCDSQAWMTENEIPMARTKTIVKQQWNDDSREATIPDIKMLPPLMAKKDALLARTKTIVEQQCSDKSRDGNIPDNDTLPALMQKNEDVSACAKAIVEQQCSDKSRDGHIPDNETLPALIQKNEDPSACAKAIVEQQCSDKNQDGHIPDNETLPASIQRNEDPSACAEAIVQKQCSDKSREGHIPDNETLPASLHKKEDPSACAKAIVPQECSEKSREPRISDIEKPPLLMLKNKAPLVHAAAIVPRKCGDTNREAQVPDIRILQTSSGLHKHSMYIAQRYYPFIVGPRAAKLAQLQNETNTKIYVPRENQPSYCGITGLNSLAIIDAVCLLEKTIKRARNTIEATHFLSIPLARGIVKTNFVKFRDSVLDECESSARSVYGRVFVKPERLHLTLGWLLLVDKKEMQAATEALVEWKSSIMMPLIEENGPIGVKVQGLDCTNGNLSIVDAIYARVSSENDALKQLADRTAKFFVQQGLMAFPHYAPKLRVKLMNAIVRDKKKPDLEIEHTRVKDLLMARKDYFFGDVVLEVLHLSACDEYDRNGNNATAAKISCLWD